MLFHTASARAQGTNVDQLAVTSHQMFEEQNDFFIYVEMMKDGFLKDRVHFHFLYEKGIISLDGKAVPEPFQTRYKKLIAEYYQRNENKKGTYGSMMCDGIKLEEVLDPNSKFRKPFMRNDLRRGEATSIIMGQLVIDGLADTNQKVKLYYDMVGITVNGRQLQGDADKRYRKMFLELLGYSATKEEDNYTMTMTP